MFLATCESSITKKTKEETDFGEEREGGKKGFVEPKLTEGEKAQGQQPPSTSRISAKDFPEIRARTLDYTMNLRNHLWLIYIYDVSLSRLMDLADLDFPIVKKRRALSDTNCRGI